MKVSIQTEVENDKLSLLISSVLGFDSKATITINPPDASASIKVSAITRSSATPTGGHGVGGPGGGK